MSSDEKKNLKNKMDAIIGIKNDECEMLKRKIEELEDELQTIKIKNQLAEEGMKAKLKEIRALNEKYEELEETLEEGKNANGENNKV